MNKQGDVPANSVFSFFECYCVGRNCSDFFTGVSWQLSVCFLHFTRTWTQRVDRCRREWSSCWRLVRSSKSLVIFCKSLDVFVSSDLTRDVRVVCSLNPHKLPLHFGDLNTPSNSRFFWPTRVNTPNGHTHLTHSYLIEHTDPPKCTNCNQLLSVKHILTECTSYDQARQQYCSFTDIKNILNLRPSQNILNFNQKSIYMINYEF